jgi:hypothetical protein
MKFSISKFMELNILTLDEQKQAQILDAPDIFESHNLQHSFGNLHA